MVIALVQKGWQFDLLRVVTFFVTFACGTAIAYSFMLLLTSLSVWMVRNQSLMEMWWLFSSLARYPKEIFAGRWAEPLGNFFTYIVPILVVSNVPANVMVRVFDPWMVVSDHRGRRGPALPQPPVLPARAAVVSQREQLNGPFRNLFRVGRAWSVRRGALSSSLRPTLQSQASLRFLQGYGCGLLGANLEQCHYPGIGTSPGDLAVKVINGNKKKLAAVRNPDNNVVGSSLIE